MGGRWHHKTNSPVTSYTPITINAIPTPFEGNSNELLEIMKHQERGCAGLTEWQTRSGSHEWENCKSITSLFFFLAPLLPQAWIEIKRENGNESRSLNHLCNAGLCVQTGKITWWFLKFYFRNLLFFLQMSAAIYQAQPAECIIPMPNLTCTLQ